ncbi:MAG: hypothetical protein HKP58_15040, partial [Desulfatitalea sp.]|nr:hypothetical protein [Desulfatitalea sp.]
PPARNAIGLVIVGGMAIGTFFTLLVIPSIYMLVAKTHKMKETDGLIPKGENAQTHNDA